LFAETQGSRERTREKESGNLVGLQPTFITEGWNAQLHGRKSGISRR
jgi:hypothetical protein